MTHPDADRNPLEVLAEEFASRVRLGETPSVQSYVEQHPELADEITELFPSIAMMEALGSKEHTERTAETSQARFAATPIERLGDFRIIREIGRGGMGVVYEAEQESLGRLVAVKVLASNAVSSPRQLLRFQREAHSAASLHHTNIVPIFGVGHQDNIHYYVMQRIDGVGLDEIVNELSGPAADQPRRPETNSDSTATGFGTLAAAAADALRNGRLVTGRSTDASSWSSSRDREHELPAAAASGLAKTLVRDSPAGARPGEMVPDGAAETPSADPPPAREAADRPLQRPELGDRYWRSVARMGVQMADAVQYAHTQHVLHRDIKPSNLLLDGQGTVWITDFGLAKQGGSDDLTNTGDIVGTLRYMAPEQFNGQCTVKSDIYSVGVTLFELLTLQPAFGESQHGMLIQKITSAGTPSPRSINPSIPRDLETIVRKATDNEPNRRYESAGRLADDLQRYLDDVPIQARRVTTPERIWRWSRRNPALAVASASVSLLLVLVAVVATWGNIRTNDALNRVSHERDNVRKAKDQAEQASKSAEQNLAFAIETFKSIISHIASRGVPASLDIELQEGETAPHETALTEADAQLLQQLVEFFEEFARNNRSDLRVETAEAYRSVGEIRRRLGQFSKSIAAYDKAMTIYQQLAKHDASLANVLARARIANEIGLVHRDKGDFLQAIRSHGTAQRLLKDSTHEIADDRRCRFELVRTYLAVASLWQPSAIVSSDFRTGGGDRSRRSGDSSPSDDEPDRAGRDRSRGDSAGGSRGDERRRDNSRDRDSIRPHELALAELERLIAEEPDNPEYKLAQAQCYRMSLRGGWLAAPRDSAAAVSKSIAILNDLVEQHPLEVAFQVELAETLLQTPASGDGNGTEGQYRVNIQRAADIAHELVENYPSVHQYRGILAGAQRKLGTIAKQSDRLELAESHFVNAVSNLEALGEDYPAVTLYQIALAQSRQQLGDLKREQGRMDDSYATLQTAVASFDMFRAARGSNPFYQRIAGSLYHSIAETLDVMGRKEEASKYRDQARSLHRPKRRRGRGAEGRRRGDSPSPAAVTGNDPARKPLAEN